MELKPTPKSISLTFFLYLIFTFCCFAQPSELLYLDNLIKKNRDITDENTLRKMYQSELQKSSSAEKKNNIEIVFNALLANLYFNDANLRNQKSDSLYHIAVSKSLKTNKNIAAWVHTEYGFYLYVTTFYKDALPFFLTASRFIDDSPTKLALQNIEILKKNAFYFGTIQNFEKEAFYLKNALKITDQNSFDYGTFLNALGNNYRNRGNNANARNYFNQTILISKKNNDHVRVAKALGDLALLYEEDKDWKKAELYLLEDIAISEKYNNARNVMYAQIQLGNLYFKTKSFTKALEVLNAAELYTKANSNLESFEEKIVKIKLAIAIEQVDSAAELNLRRRLDKISRLISKTNGEQVINSVNLEAQNENIKVQLSAEKVKAENEQLFKTFLLNISFILFFIVVLLFIMNKRKLKYKQIEFDQKILSFQIDKVKSETKLQETNHTLSSYKTYLLEKNQQVKNLEEEIAKKDHSAVAVERKEVYKKLLDSHLLTEDNWQNFKLQFIDEQKEFYETITKKYSDLTESNLRLIMLIKMELTNQNIANLLGVTLEAVKKAKQRLKKKHVTIFKELE